MNSTSILKSRSGIFGNRENLIVLNLYIDLFNSTSSLAPIPLKGLQEDARGYRGVCGGAVAVPVDAGGGRRCPGTTLGRRARPARDGVRSGRGAYRAGKMNARLRELAALAIGQSGSHNLILII